MFNGADGAFDLYEDTDGREGECVVTRFHFKAGKIAELTMEIDGNAAGVIPENRCYDVCLRGVQRPSSVTLDDSDTQWCYDEEKKELRVSVSGENRRAFHIRIEVQDATIAAPDKKQAVYRILHRAQIPYLVKTAVFDAVCGEPSVARILGRLHEINMPESLTGAMLEQVLSEC